MQETTYAADGQFEIPISVILHCGWLHVYDPVRHHQRSRTEYYTKANSVLPPSQYSAGKKLPVTVELRPTHLQLQQSFTAKTTASTITPTPVRRADRKPDIWKERRKTLGSGCIEPRYLEYLMQAACGMTDSKHPC